MSKNDPTLPILALLSNSWRILDSFFSDFKKEKKTVNLILFRDVLDTRPVKGFITN